MRQYASGKYKSMSHKTDNLIMCICIYRYVMKIIIVDLKDTRYAITIVTYN